LRYYRKIDGMLAATQKRVSGFNSVLKTRDINRIRSELNEVRTSLSATAHRASELGGFRGDRVLNWALLDVLEFYESLYSDHMPLMIEVGFSGDRVQYQELDLAYRARLKNELPPLEQAYIQAEKAFAVKYDLKSTTGDATRDRIDRQLDDQNQHVDQGAR